METKNELVLPTFKVTPIELKEKSVYFPEYDVNVYNIKPVQIVQGLDGTATELFGRSIELVASIINKNDYQ